MYIFAFMEAALASSGAFQCECVALHPGKLWAVDCVEKLDYRSNATYSFKRP